MLGMASESGYSLGDDRTPVTILNRIHDQRDHAAWQEFFAFCEAQFRKYGRRQGIDFQMNEEIHCEAWNSLWKKMLTFQYDPGKGFRNWLYIFYCCRLRDYRERVARERRRHVDLPAEEIRHHLPSWIDRQFEDDAEIPIPTTTRELFRAAREIQEAIRSKFAESSWQAYWMVEIEQTVTVEEAAKMLKISRTAVYKSIDRIKKRLIAQGLRHLDKAGREAPEF